MKGLAPLSSPSLLTGHEWALVQDMFSEAAECKARNNMPGFVAWTKAAQMVRDRLSRVDVDISKPAPLGPTEFKVTTA